MGAYAYPKATARQIKVARELARMASAYPHEPKITYEPTGMVLKDYRFTWHSMKATKDDGTSWDYWLAKDYGSYRGSFPPETNS